jgi:AraC-like DNA-binding protein
MALYEPIDVATDTRRKKLLQQQVQARKIEQSKASRAKILIKVDENPHWTDAQIADEIGCSSGLVRKWRKRRCHSILDFGF